MKKVIVYPGRFQPMLAHHAEVFQRLQAEHPDTTVYIGTSNKVVPPDSPFDFSEKQQIGQAHGVPADQILQVRSPYNKDDYPFDQQSTQLIIAVGEKDTQRFPFNNTDPETGLDMNAKGEPKYLQPISVLEQNPAHSMDQHAYILVTPNVQTDDKISSASAFRNAIRNAPDQETAKQVYTEQFGEYNDQLFTLIYNKLTQGTTNMNEQLNQMRRLAGMTIQESEFQKGDMVTVAGKDYTGTIKTINDSVATVEWHTQATSYRTTVKVSSLQKADKKKIQEGAPVGFYDMTDQERQLAAWGRVLMHKATLTKDDEFSNAMATVGDLLTRWGTQGGPTSQEDIEQKAGITTDMLEKFLAFAEKHQDEQPEVPDPQGDDEDDLDEASYHSELSKRDQDMQRGMDSEKADFKRHEMEIELGDEEETYRKAMQGPFYLKRDDKIIRDKQGEPFSFNSREAATRAAQTMMQKPWNKGKKFYLAKSLDETEQYMNSADLQEEDSGVLPGTPEANRMIRPLAKKFVANHAEVIDTDEYTDTAIEFLTKYIQDDGSEAFIDACSDFDYIVNQLAEMSESDSNDDFVMPNESVEQNVQQASDQALAEIRKLAGL